MQDFPLVSISSESFVALGDEALAAVFEGWVLFPSTLFFFAVKGVVSVLEDTGASFVAPFF